MPGLEIMIRIEVLIHMGEARVASNVGIVGKHLRSLGVVLVATTTNGAVIVVAGPVRDLALVVVLVVAVKVLVATTTTKEEHFTLKVLPALQLSST
jgi:ABC-type enterochelin transport system permease subunit